MKLLNFQNDYMKKNRINIWSAIHLLKKLTFDQPTTLH